jgi:hypothetical protein
MKNLIKNSNTTTYNRDTVYANAYEVFSCRSFTVGKINYQTSTFKLWEPEYIEMMLEEAGNAHNAKKFVEKAWFSPKPIHEMISKERAILLHDLLQLVLSDPLAYTTLPIIDMLAFTLDLSPKQLRKWKRVLENFNSEDVHLFKRGPVSVLDNCTERYQHFALFKVGSNANVIRVYWGLTSKIRKARPNQRLFKIEFNPARFSSDELIIFFSWLKSAKAFSYDNKMKVANVTRIDTALDLIGVPVSSIFIDKPNVSVFDFISNELPSGVKQVGTQIIGDPSSSNLKVYNKDQQVVDTSNQSVKLLAYKNGQLVPITRVERKYKPADGTPLTLSELERTPYFLSDTKIYSPNLLRELTSKERREIDSCGFAYWLNILSDDVREGHIRWLMDSNEMYVNDEALFGVQHTHLENIKNIILNV